MLLDTTEYRERIAKRYSSSVSMVTGTYLVPGHTHYYYSVVKQHFPVMYLDKHVM